VSIKTATILADLPRVNLLPPEIHENRDFRRLATGLGALVALSIVGVGALYVHGKSAVQSATDALAADQQQQVTLQRELTKLQYVVTAAANEATAEEEEVAKPRAATRARKASTASKAGSERKPATRRKRA